MYTYRGSIVSNTCDTDEVIAARKRKAHQAFHKLQSVWKSRAPRTIKKTGIFEQRQYYMAEILPIRRKTLSNQSINFKFFPPIYGSKNMERDNNYKQQDSSLCKLVS